MHKALFIILETNAQHKRDQGVIKRRRGNVRQNTVRVVEIGRRQNAQTPGEMNVAQELKKSVMSTIDQYRYLMRRMNVILEKNVDAKSIGKNPSREGRFGLIIQIPANSTTFLTVNL